MILLYLLLVFRSLSSEAAKVEVDKKVNIISNDEVKFATGRYMLTNDEKKEVKDILDKKQFNLYTVEVMVMLDYSIYDWWFKIYKDPKKTEAALKAYYAHIFLKIKMRYNILQIKGKKYDIKVVGIEIAKSTKEVPFVENEHKVSKDAVDSYIILFNLTNWLMKERKKFPRYDVFAFFTKYDMGIFNGLAWPEAACSDHGVSVTKEMGFYDTYHSVTHEIGHNLGSHHDDDVNCSYDDQYIMAAGTEYFRDENFHKRHTFSSCSKSRFDKYIDKMDRESGNCLVIQSSKKPLELGSYASRPFGETFDVDRQCQIIMGVNSFFCAGGDENFKNMCREITCWNATESKCAKGPKSAPGDGTPCESKMSCQNETCESDPKAKQGKVGCYFGDWKGKMLDDYSKYITCAEVKKSKTYLCYLKDIALACCDTCQQVYQPEKKDCEYGDHFGGCTKSKCTYNMESSCCRTCERNASDPCQFGDKASWCKDIKQSECYISEDVCCKRCKQMEDKTKKDCRYGDSRQSCPKEVKSLPKRCLKDAFRKDCCISCEPIKPGQCMDLDPDVCKTIRPYSCYSSDTLQDCCKTCQGFKKKDAPKGCQYGDRHDGCGKHHCKNDKETCCYTCKAK